MPLPPGQRSLRDVARDLRCSAGSAGCIALQRAATLLEEAAASRAPLGPHVDFLLAERARFRRHYALDANGLPPPDPL